jgi:hypothetical protein
MSKKSYSNYVCRFNNRVREVIESAREEGIITREQEGEILKRMDSVHTTLHFSELKWRKAYQDSINLYENNLENNLSHTPFNLRDFATTLNKLVCLELFKLEDRRIKINSLKNGSRLNNRALDRIKIRLNEVVSSLLIISDDLNAMIDCENDSDLEFLLMSSSNQE